MSHGSLWFSTVDFCLTVSIIYVESSMGVSDTKKNVLYVLQSRPRLDNIYFILKFVFFFNDSVADAIFDLGFSS
jgi:hypothetical protein